MKLGKSFLPFLSVKTFRMWGGPAHLTLGSNAETGDTPQAPSRGVRESASLPY